MTGRVRAALARHRVTLALAALVLVGSLVSGTASGDSAAIALWGISPDTLGGGRGLVAAFASSVLAAGWPGLLLALLAVLIGVGIAERTMGPWRTLVVFTATGAIGALAGVGFSAVRLLLEGRIAEADVGRPVLDPLTAVVGTVFVASAFAAQLWRRRIRILGLGVLVVVATYTGAPTDGARISAALVGIALGMLLAPGRRVLSRIPTSSHRERRILLAGATLLAGLGPVVTLVSHHPVGPLHALTHPQPAVGAALTAVCSSGDATAECVAAVAAARASDVPAVLVSFLPLLVLVLAAWALARGRRAGLRLAVGGLVFSSLCSLVFDVILPLAPDADQIVAPAAPIDTGLAVVLPLLLAVVLVASREVFPVAATTRARILFWSATAVAFLVGLGAGVGTRDDRAVLSLLERYVPVGFLDLRLPGAAVDGPASFVAEWGGALFWTAVLVAGVNLVLDVPRRAGTTDRDRVRGLLRQGSTGSIGHMALWPGSDYWFAPGNGAGVAYRVVADVAVTLGGPLGEPCCHRDTIRGFAAFCERNGWVPAFYSIDAGLGEVFDDLGWCRTEVGDDAVLLPDEFTLAGRRGKDVRTAMNRAERTGLTARWTTWAEMSLVERNQVRIISEAWVAGRNLPEMGFTLGGIDELVDPSVRLMLAVDPPGTVLAVTSWLPSWRNGTLDGWTLDFMRRRDGAMNGIMEFLIASTVLRAKDDGVRFVSLSTAPLAGIGASGRDTGVAGQVLGYVGRRLESLYGFKSLLAFKDKFGPQRRPVFIAYPEPLVLPAIGVALMRAYLPSMTVRQLVAVARRIVGRPDGRGAPEPGRKSTADPQPVSGR